MVTSTLDSEYPSPCGTDCDFGIVLDRTSFAVCWERKGSFNGKRATDINSSSLCSRASRLIGTFGLHVEINVHY